MAILSTGKLIFGLPKLLFKYWYIVGFIMFVLPSIVISIDAAIAGEDWQGPLKQGGRYLASHDAIIYDYIENLEFSPEGNLTDYYFNFWKDLLWTVWKSIWALIFTFMLLFKAIRFLLGDKSADLRAFLITVAVMALMQILVVGYPFKGLISLFKFVIYEVIL